MASWAFRRQLTQSTRRSQKVHWGLVRIIMVFPGTVLVFIPVVLVWVSKDSKFSAALAPADQIRFWLALFVGSIGLGLCLWTVRIFKKFGKGTPAPWNPPKKLVVRGPYRYVRNPMICGVVLMLLAEALLLQSWPIAFWMVIFFMANSVYFALIEAKNLENRFGDDYREYTSHVRRWLPRIRPWNQ
jgi:protein-S-isoprenylcysteine O-methyltransferase Ste14